MNHQTAAFNAALQVAQQAITLLAEWADLQLPPECVCTTEYSIVERVKRDILPWRSGDRPQALRLLFDRVKLNKERGEDKTHYWQPKAIVNDPSHQYPNIVYPQTDKPDLEPLRQEVGDALRQLDGKDWKNLSLLMLILEKFGSYISLGEDDTALVDVVRSTAAVAAALAQHPESEEISLIAGDLSGIQKFIYTISSEGALKSLRARSFYLELVTEEVVQQLLETLKLPRTNVIYAGGGNLYILADGRKETKVTIDKIRQQINKWLLGEFQGKVFLALDCSNFPVSKIATAEFGDCWSELTSKKLSQQKKHKFAQFPEFIQERDSHEICPICHRDDIKQLKQIKSQETDSINACDTCYDMFYLGEKLLRVEAIVRSHKENKDACHTLKFDFSNTSDHSVENVYYNLYPNWKQVIVSNDANNEDTVLIVNDWTVEHYQFRHFRNPVLLLLGNYGQGTQKPDETGFMRAEEMAEKAQGIDRVGYLRMDVDRLGRIFAEGLGESITLPRIAGMSRYISYFFKVYLNSLAASREPREANLPSTLKKLASENERLNLLFIYAGGDDLFISGAWNEVVEFAFTVYQCFRAYTGHNPDITLSAGISIDDVKFPLYQAAEASGKAESAAKDNGRDSLGLFNQFFKWDEWFGTAQQVSFDEQNKGYQNPEVKPKLLGVLPFVERLVKQDIGINSSRSFIRNLLITAEIQEQALKNFEDCNSTEAKDTRYYLHLPKIAYTLSRLPNRVLDDTEFRTSLKNPYNATYFRAIATWIEFLQRKQ